MKPRRNLTRKVLDTVTADEWEGYLDRVAEKGPAGLLEIGERRGYLPHTFMRWIMEDDDRRSEYYEALAAHAELADAKCQTIADGDGDVNRDKLRIDTRFKQMRVWNRSRFGEKDGSNHAQITVVVNRGGVEVAVNEALPPGTPALESPTTLQLDA